LTACRVNPSDGTQRRYGRADSLLVDLFISSGPDSNRCDLTCSSTAFDTEYAKLRAGCTDLVTIGVVRAAHLFTALTGNAKP
jgi:hypothetical protein